MGARGNARIVIGHELRFVQSFRHGDAVPMPSAIFHAVFGQHIQHAEPEHHVWHIQTPDNSNADIYATSIASSARA